MLFGAVELGAVDKLDDTRGGESYNRALGLMQKPTGRGGGIIPRSNRPQSQSKNLDIFLYNSGRADYHQRAYTEAAAAFENLSISFPNRG